MPQISAKPSDWIAAHYSLLPPGGRILDLAAGSGRHSRYLLDKGFHVTAVDRDTSRLAGLAGLKQLEILTLDLETDAWPLTGRWDGIVVTNYLHRPALQHYPQHLTHQGVLLIDTFNQGQEHLGRPRNPDYLLKHGELLTTYAGNLEVLAWDQVFFAQPGAYRQRICARKP